ncbi:EAL domain-containing protein [Vibrio sp. SCSIO 43136]|uniref:EAL and HDOD domain-containing protein n=1 Tax=Vibrio sp. SCSIO 43136 TaxID=2819101 RepID=UPI00207600C1|nr:EAL domain-containing protein [Vibrio sp. SCSIO 43136]USD65377.1 EAL domain-containing protein [Vibrio sp. SCSIO 43136]
MYTYVARQPILNGKRHTLGYELLFRDGENNAFPAHVDSNRATYRLIAENFLSFQELTTAQPLRYFINFSHESLVRLLPMALPKEHIVVEILETCRPTDELLQAVRYLHRNGYKIALDDFDLGPEWQRFLPFARIIKIDLMQVGVEKACEYVQARRSQGCSRKYVAERVETAEEFAATQAAGFHFFQGYFFSKPEIIRNRAVKPEQVLAMQLFYEVCKPQVDYKKVEFLISGDVSLSYQLLKFVNGFSHRITVPISSFKQALVYLGQDRLKQFVSLVVASYVAINKPAELRKLSLQRARFCHLMTRYQPFSDQRDQAFLLGLLSLLDSFLDQSMDHLLSQLPLSTELNVALLERGGVLGRLLALEEQFEQANWLQVENLCKQLKLEVSDVKHELVQAMAWSEQIQASLE